MRDIKKREKAGYFNKCNQWAKMRCLSRTTRNTWSYFVRGIFELKLSQQGNKSFPSFHPKFSGIKPGFTESSERWKHFHFLLQKLWRRDSSCRGLTQRLQGYLAVTEGLLLDRSRRGANSSNTQNLGSSLQALLTANIKSATLTEAIRHHRSQSSRFWATLFFRKFCRTACLPHVFAICDNPSKLFSHYCLAI